MMYPLSKIYHETLETLKYYRDEILGILGWLVPGIVGIYILKCTSALSFLEHHSNFDIILMLLILLFLEGMVALLQRTTTP